MLFKEGSSADRGTLYQIKNLYQHRSVKKKVMNNFNSVTDLLKFTTHSLTLLLAMQISKLSSVSSIPEGSMPTLGLDDKKTFLQDLASKVVNEIWHQFEPSEIAKITQDDQGHGGK